MNSKKKKIIIISIVVILVLILTLTIYLLNKNKKSTSETSVYDNADSNLSQAVVLSEADNELIAVLKNVDTYLQNFSIDEDSINQEQFMFLLSIGGAFEGGTIHNTNLKEYISQIYEARKYIDNNEKTTYLFDVEVVDKGNLLNTKRTIIMVCDGIIKYLNLNLHDINFTNEIFTEDELNNFALVEAFYGSYFTSICTQVSNTWEKATPFENVNYENIWNNI